MIRDIVQPGHINVDEPFTGCFFNHDQDEAARWIVKFLDSIDYGWDDFHKDSLNVFYQRSIGNVPGAGPFAFHGLIMDGFLSIVGDVVTVHDSFIRKIASRIK